MEVCCVRMGLGCKVDRFDGVDAKFGRNSQF